jgi:hypothetical protein
MDKDLMERTLSAINRLNGSYRIDRYATIAAALAIIGLLFYLALKAFSGPNPQWGLLGLFFGANGLLTVAMLYLTKPYNEGFKLLSELVRHEMTAGRDK